MLRSILARKSVKMVQCPVEGLVMREVEEHIMHDILAERVRGARVLLKERYWAARTNVGRKLFGPDYTYEELACCPLQGWYFKTKESLFQKTLQRYEILDEKAPRLTKCATGAMCAFMGESVVQCQLGTMDVNRLQAMPCINIFWIGTCMSMWLKLMEQTFPNQNCMRSIALKTVITSIVLQPLYVGVLLVGTEILLDKRGEKLVEENSDQDLVVRDPAATYEMRQETVDDPTFSAIHLPDHRGTLPSDHLRFEMGDQNAGFMRDVDQVARTTSKGVTAVVSEVIGDNAGLLRTHINVIQSLQTGLARFTPMMNSFQTRCQNEGWTLMVAGWATNPLIYGAQYLLIPKRLHILYLCAVNFGYGVLASTFLR